MAVNSNSNNKNVIYGLALLYHTKTNKYTEAEKYYKIAIDKGHINAIHDLAALYHTKLHNIDNAAKYYLMALKAGIIKPSRENFTILIHRIDNKKKRETLSLKMLLFTDLDELNKINNLDEEIRKYMDKELLNYLYPHLQSLTNISNELKEIIENYNML